MYSMITEWSHTGFRYGLHFSSNSMISPFRVRCLARQRVTRGWTPRPVKPDFFRWRMVTHSDPEDQTMSSARFTARTRENVTTTCNNCESPWKLLKGALPANAQWTRTAVLISVWCLAPTVHQSKLDFLAKVSTHARQRGRGKQVTGIHRSLHQQSSSPSNVQVILYLSISIRESFFLILGYMTLNAALWCFRISLGWSKQCKSCARDFGVTYRIVYSTIPAYSCVFLHIPYICPTYAHVVLVLTGYSAQRMFQPSEAENHSWHHSFFEFENAKANFNSWETPRQLRLQQSLSESAALRPSGACCKKRREDEDEKYMKESIGTIRMCNKNQYDMTWIISSDAGRVSC